LFYIPCRSRSAGRRVYLNILRLCRNWGIWI